MTLVLVAFVLGTACQLPFPIFCDSIYFEKYYAARRFVPLDHNTLLPYNITVVLPTHFELFPYERLAMVGNINKLGSWRADQAIFLNRTSSNNVWTGSVYLPQNSSIEYRYFSASVDFNGAVQVRHWESYVHSRKFETLKSGGNRTDIFGSIENHIELSRGWLQHSEIVQFKLFRKPLKLIEALPSEISLRIRLHPVDPTTLTPLITSASANMEYVIMTEGNSILRAQSEFGVSFTSDIIIFHTTVARLQNVAYLVQVFITKPDNDLVNLLGYQYIQPSRLVQSEGNFTINLISPGFQIIIGYLNLQYLIIKPMTKSRADFRTSFAKYWQPNWNKLEIGHRGLGKSFAMSKNYAPLPENTEASLLQAAYLGADLVEFDVHVTKDLVPIIYHDYSIYVCIDSKTPTSINDLSKVFLKDITYEQLKNLKTYNVIGKKIVEYQAHNDMAKIDQRLFPSLQDLLARINITIGFDIEIRWPQLLYDGTYESEQTIDKNLFVDIILEVVQSSGCGRFIIFKSFDADICTMLRLKQNTYPVFFLTSNKQNVFADPRTETVIQSINFAQAFDLAGIMPNVICIKDNPGLLNRAKMHRLRVIVWGSDIKDRKTIDWINSQGATGVIYDRMDLLLPSNRTRKADFPAFFSKQCDLLIRNSISK